MSIAQATRVKELEQELQKLRLTVAELAERIAKIEQARKPLQLPKRQ